jgi:hypothetical protein
MQLGLVGIPLLIGTLKVSLLFQLMALILLALCSSYISIFKLLFNDHCHNADACHHNHFNCIVVEYFICTERGKAYYSIIMCNAKLCISIVQSCICLNFFEISCI